MIDLKRLISYEYFPSELPPCFSTSSLGKNINDILPMFDRTDFAKFSVPLAFSYYKSEQTRRIFSIPNPFHYIKAAKYICDHYEEIEAVYTKSSFSLTKPNALQDEDGKTAFTRVSESPKDTFKIEESLYKDNTICVKLDISAFYDSIYTHSISWAIHTKEVAKRQKNDTGLLGNKIDIALMSINGNQTNGILIGNAVSRLVAEIILCNIDKKIKEEFLELDIYRYIDDYSIYLKDSFVDNSYNPQRVISFIRDELFKYQLHLNETKTKIFEAPFVYKNGVDEVKSILMENPKNYLSQLILIYKKYKEISVLKYGLKILDYKISDDNIKEITPLLFNLWIKFPSLTDRIMQIIFKYKNLFEKNNLKNVLYSIINLCISLKKDTEVIWAVYALKEFDIIIENAMSEKIILSKNDLAIIILLEANKALDDITYKELVEHLKKELTDVEGSLLDESKNKRSPNEQEKLLWSARWLLTYEATLKKLIKNNNRDFNFVNGNPFFKLLKQKKIKFYDASKHIQDVEGFQVSDFITRKEFTGYMQSISNLIEKGHTAEAKEEIAKFNERIKKSEEAESYGR